MTTGILFILFLSIKTTTGLLSTSDTIKVQTNTIEGERSLDEAAITTRPKVVRSQIECTYICHSMSECCISSSDVVSAKCLVDTSGCCSVETTVSSPGSVLVYIAQAGKSSRDCTDITTRRSGVYKIYLTKAGSAFEKEVYCEMEIDGGGWMVFQRRLNGKIDFYRNWQTYKEGFGDVCGEYWLGNELLYLLTANEQYELRVDLEDWENGTRFAVYGTFRVGDESSNYKLTVENYYDGNAGDSLDYHNQQVFSTFDKDKHDCSKDRKGGWWYDKCDQANLNGLYKKAESSVPNVVSWDTFTGHKYSLKQTTMMIKRKLAE